MRKLGVSNRGLIWIACYQICTTGSYRYSFSFGLEPSGCTIGADGVTNDFPNTLWWAFMAYGTARGTKSHVLFSGDVMATEGASP
jgi:hypothetical protein